MSWSRSPARNCSKILWLTLKDRLSIVFSTDCRKQLWPPTRGRIGKSQCVSALGWSDQNLIEGNKSVKPELNTNNTAGAVAQERFVRHVCGSCIYRATGEDGGWMRFASHENPRKTEWCALCNHRAEGVDMPVYRHKWGGFRISPNSKLS